MESYSVKNLSFSYPQGDRKVLDDISFTIKKGDFVVVCGSSGCGKTTLLRHLKTVLTPNGETTGQIYFENTLLHKLDQRRQASQIGFVLQSPENQLVTDKVWHELAFGLESLGYKTPEIRLRVAEMASFFGIHKWFHKNVSDLSGGQKQILNLAAVMVMQPSVLILDEPTSQLDPIAASNFIETLEKINQDLGTTIILTEHRLDEALPLAHKVILIDKGEIFADSSPREVGEILAREKHEMFLAMPVPARVCAGVENKLGGHLKVCPLTVREGRGWLEEFSKTKEIIFKEDKDDKKELVEEKPSVRLKETWFKYEENSEDILRGLSLQAYKGETLAILGGNGTGKTSALSLIAGINKPYRGEVFTRGLVGIVPQDPQTLFVKSSVRLDLYEMLEEYKISKEEKEARLKKIASLTRIDHLLNHHPYDLSGGEQQRLALAKVLLLEPQILLLDEPTKGMDAGFKEVFAEILEKLKSQGVTIIMVSHDIEFCASQADKCALLFDGSLVVHEKTRDFFTGNSFYTTAANKMARHLAPQVVTADDLVRACGGQPLKVKKPPVQPMSFLDVPEERPENLAEVKKKRNFSKRTMLATLLILLVIPLTIYLGTSYLGDRKYYFISLLIILEISLPFIMIFEEKKPQARELVVLAVLCALAVAGRAAFFMLPQFKPVAAIVIITGVAFGGESGFLVGALTMFLSNMIYGQGPLTPWQMFAMGIIGFLAGVFFNKGRLSRKRLPLAIFGGIAVVFVYGGIMNPASIIIFQSKITWPMILSTWLLGLPFDLIHGGATVFFLLLIGEPMLEKLDRIKLKYGLIKKA